MDINPGAMGKPLPGVAAADVRKSERGAMGEINEPDVQGELALKPGWPPMLRAHLNEPERYRKCFAGGFYLTGDLARRDAEVVAQIAEHAFDDLDAPLGRVCSAAAPMPYAKHMEDAALPQPETIVRTVRAVLGKNTLN